MAVVECYGVLSREYNVELTNIRKLVVKLDSNTCTCRKWQMIGLPYWYALVVIAKANLLVYDFVHPMYKVDIQHHIYNQLVHPMETGVT